VATEFDLAASLADPEKEAEKCTAEGLGLILIALMQSVVQASPAEVKNWSEVLDVVEWVYCREGGEGEGEEPKAQQRRPGERVVWACSEMAVVLLPRTGAVA
jgi:hypothetical protein